MALNEQSTCHSLRELLRQVEHLYEIVQMRNDVTRHSRAIGTCYGAISYAYQTLVTVPASHESFALTLASELIAAFVAIGSEGVAFASWRRKRLKIEQN